MSREQDNKAIVGRWFDGFWGNPWNPKIIDELAAPDILLQYSLHQPRRGREDVMEFMTGFREAFPDLNFWGAADLIAEGDYVVVECRGRVTTKAGLPYNNTYCYVIRLEGGKLRELTDYQDTALVEDALGDPT